MLQKVSEVLWEIPVSFKPGMRVPARIYGTEKLVSEMDAAVFEQVANVACLPGIVRYASACPTGLLVATLRGERIDPDRHGLRADVKAVTLHGFSLVRRGSGWEATVVLDI